MMGFITFIVFAVLLVLGCAAGYVSGWLLGMALETTVEGALILGVSGAVLGIYLTYKLLVARN